MTPKVKPIEWKPNGCLRELQIQAGDMLSMAPNLTLQLVFEDMHRVAAHGQLGTLAVDNLSASPKGGA